MSLFEKGKLFDKAGEQFREHNLGWYPTPTDLRAAYPSAGAGDFATVASTGTIWTWDESDADWADSEVENTTQAQSDWEQIDTAAIDYIKNKPTLGTAAAEDTTAFATASQGGKADTAVQPADLATVATSGSYADLSNTPTIPVVQVTTLPTAASTELGNIYQFVGATDSTYTNGYFYACVSDGEEIPTYSWAQINVQPLVNELPATTGLSDGGYSLHATITDGVATLSWVADAE